MTAGSASTSRDSPPVFNNILAYKDEVVPWMRQLVDACHEYGTAVMIQLSHLGRRTRWDKADWMPVVSPSHKREAAHRAFPKKIEDWDIERIIKDFGDAAECMKAAGLDGIELEAYGHSLEQFWSPLLALRRLARQSPPLHVRRVVRDPQARRARLYRGRPLHRRRGPRGRPQ